MTEDIRNKEIKIKVRKTEVCMDAIKRYMSKHGFINFKRSCKGLFEYDRWYSDGYSELWVSSQNFNETTNTVTFALQGNL